MTYDEWPLASVAWEGDSLEVLQGFPKEVRADLGFALYLLQCGDFPADARPMKSIGAGVFELKASDHRAWYRVVYLSKVGNTIYVLHCFEKQSRKTSRVDLETAKTRLRRTLTRIREEML